MPQSRQPYGKGELYDFETHDGTDQTMQGIKDAQRDAVRFLLAPCSSVLTIAENRRTGTREQNGARDEDPQSFSFNESVRFSICRTC